MPSFTRFVISREKVCTLLYWKAGEVSFYKKNDRNDEGFEMQGLIPWQKTIKEELENHLDYSPSSSVSFRFVIKKDKEGHYTYFVCPHKISNKLMWKDLQLFQSLTTYVVIKCTKCASRMNHRKEKHEPVKKFKSDRRNPPAEKNSSHSSASRHLNSSIAPQQQMSPEEFMSSISEECDRFKEKIMGKISAYFNVVRTAQTSRRNICNDDNDENNIAQPTPETVIVKNEPIERLLVSGSSASNLRQRRVKSSTNITAWSWEENNEDENEDEDEAKYDCSNLFL